MTTIKTYLYCNSGIIIPAIIECKSTPGIGIQFYGLASEKIKECILRTSTALLSTGYRIPGKKLTINVLPQADNNTSNLLDTAIALAIRKAKDNIEPDFSVIGELALDGSARKNGIIEEIAEYHTAMHPDKILYVPESQDIPKNNCIRYFKNLSDLFAKF